MASSYCSVDDVKEEFKDLPLDSGTSLKKKQIEKFIEQASTHIDAKLAVKYTVPITGEASKIIVQQIATWLVAGRVKDILQVKTTTTEINQDVREDDLAYRANKMLADIVKGVLPLPDQTAATSDDGLSSFNVSSGQEHFFKKNETQW